MSSGPTIEAIRQAHGRIAPHILRTPFLRNSSLDSRAGAQLFFKCENLQKTGSFKIRGATNAIFSLPDVEARRGVVTHSSGNHGAAVACAAGWRGIPAWIVVPRNAPEVKRRAIADFGGEIHLCGPTMEAREAAARDIAERTGAALVHPYDDDRIIAGQGTAALELLEDAGPLDVILAPVSGGGLLAGTAIAAQSLQPGIRVIGCEPAGADDAWRSLRLGALQKNEKAETIADGLRASLSARTFAILRERVEDVALVEEDEILETMHLIRDRLKMAIEPSAAVSAATAVLAKLPFEKQRVGILLTGGNLDFERFFPAP